MNTLVQRQERITANANVVDKYATRKGIAYLGDSLRILDGTIGKRLEGKVQLVFTSPPFPLNRKKEYGNLEGEAYLTWIEGYASRLTKLLTPNGSIVIEIGNAWNKGLPTMSTLPIEALLRFKRSGNLHLCQEFICNNPARLPSPIQWVNVERIRVKDSFTRLWWLSPIAKPKADNRHVLKEYSTAMKSLLKSGQYNSGRRPSEYVIGAKSFAKDNGGAIPGSVLEYSNTSSYDPFSVVCRESHLQLHPARMAGGLVEFFVNMLTDSNDIVFDPFAGSNTTGAVAESLGRRWRSIEIDATYFNASKRRFEGSPDCTHVTCAAGSRTGARKR